MTAVFARITQAVLAHLGEDGFLRGDEPIKVHVDYNVQMVDREGNVYVATHVLTINRVDSALPGDPVLVQIKDATGAVTRTDSYVLETRLDDNGYSTRFVARLED